MEVFFSIYNWCTVLKNRESTASYTMKWKLIDTGNKAGEQIFRFVILIQQQP